MYIYVCMYVCMYVSMYVCKYVCMYACKYVRVYVCMYVPAHLGMSRLETLQSRLGMSTCINDTSMMQ